MAGGDEWIYVLSRQEESNDSGGRGSRSPRSRTDDGEEDARSDGGRSYGSEEVNEYFDYIEDEEEDDADAAAEALRALDINEAPDAAVGGSRVSGGRGKDKEVVVENPYYDCYGGEAAYYEYDYGHGHGYEYGSGSGSAFRGYGASSISISASGGYGPGYDERYGTAGYGYDRYGYGGGNAYGSGYGDAYGYGYSYGGYRYYQAYDPLDPRAHLSSVVYRAPPAYGATPYPQAVPYMYFPYPAHGPAYAPPPPARRHPARAD